jgi:hypothetical protein
MEGMCPYLIWAPLLICSCRKRGLCHMCAAIMTWLAGGAADPKHQAEHLNQAARRANKTHIYINARCPRSTSSSRSSKCAAQQPSIVSSPLRSRPPLEKLPQRVVNNLQNSFFAFAGIIVGVSVWAIWRSDPLIDSPSMDDPFGDPSEWSEPEMRRWLNAVCHRESFLET